GLADLPEGPGQVTHVLLGREPADVADHHVVGPEALGLADVRPARPVGAEEPAVDPPGPEDQALETPTLEIRDRGPRGDVGLEGPVVEPAEISPGQSLNPAQPIVVAILVEVGVEAG